jgi:hypothetical protein
MVVAEELVGAVDEMDFQRGPPRRDYTVAGCVARGFSKPVALEGRAACARAALAPEGEKMV